MGRSLSLVLLAALTFTAIACGPSIDPAAKADLDRHLSEITTSEETFPPSESYSAMAFVVGQWTVHRITDDQGHASLVTYKLVGQENGAFWLEIVTETPTGREVAKILVAMLSGRDPAGMEIRAIRLKKGTAVVDVDPGVVPELRAKYRRSLDLLAIAVEGNDKDDVRVPAGHFIGCYRVETPDAWGPWKFPADVCTHPTVPLSGVVRATPSGAAGLVELIRFGVSGAESEF